MEPSSNNNTNNPAQTGPNSPQYGPPAPSSSRGSQHDGLKSILSTLAIIIIAPLIALTLTAFVFQSYQVDGPSMESTLQNNNRLIVTKVGRTWSRLTRHAYIPHRTDIIIFNKYDLGNYGGNNNEKQLIKRVIGLPGDRVVVRDGTLTIYNKEHSDGFQPDKTYTYGKVITTTAGNIDIVVPPNQVFVCGDNRPNSLDSRAFGTIPASSIVGKLSFRIFPFNEAEHF
jgi:signal peptidase I